MSRIVMRGHRSIAAFLLALLLSGCPTGRPPVVQKDGPPALDAPSWIDLVRDGFHNPADTVPAVDRRRGDTRPRDVKPHIDAHQQKTSCSAGGVSFKATTPPKGCSSVNVTISAPTSYNWVLAAVKDASGNGTWKADPDPVVSNPCCSWTWQALPVPCPGAAPFSFSLMYDAQNNNTAVGKIAASCTP